MGLKTVNDGLLEAQTQSLPAGLIASSNTLVVSSRCLIVHMFLINQDSRFETAAMHRMTKLCGFGG